MHDQKLLYNHIARQKARAEAGEAASRMVVNILADLANMVMDSGIVGAFAIDIARLIVHLVTLGVDIAKAAGVVMPGWVTALVDVANGIVTVLSAVQGFFAFLFPGEALEGLLGRFVNTARDKFVKYSMWALRALSWGTFLTNSGYQHQMKQVEGYTTNQAYQACVQDGLSGC